MLILEAIIPFVLSACGMIMISSLSLRNSMAAGNPFAPPLRQFQFIGLGVTFMFVCTLFRTESFRKHSAKIFVVAWGLLILTLIPGLGVKVGGARRWLALPGFRFQPLEFVLFALPIFMAKRLNENEVSLSRGDFHSFLSPTLSTILILVIPLLLQPNLGGSILVAGICMTMHIERRGWKYPLLGGVLGVAIVALLIFTSSYRLRRFYAFWDPWEDPMGKGFQIIQGLVAFANGSLTGVGIGKGLQEERYLPEAETDYIFPAIGEEFGLVGTLFLVSLYALWTWQIYYIYRDAKSPFTKSLALGLAASVIYPMFVNVAGVTKLLPLSGIPMPFISAGGSSMMFMWAKVGLLLKIKSENKEPPKENKKKKVKVKKEHKEI